MRKSPQELHEFFEKVFNDGETVPEQYRKKMLFSDRMFMEKMFRKAYEEGLSDSPYAWHPVPDGCIVDMSAFKGCSKSWVLVMDKVSNIDICEVTPEGKIEIDCLMDTYVDREGSHLFMPIPINADRKNMEHLGWSVLEDIISKNTPEEGEVLYVVAKDCTELLVTSFENGRIKDMTSPDGTDREITEKDVLYYYRKGARKF